MIVYQSNKYSVPSKYIGLQVKIRPTLTELNIYYNGQLISTHLLLTNDSPVPFSYHTEDVVDILHSDLKTQASDDKIMSFMHDQMNYYDFMMSSDESNGD